MPQRPSTSRRPASAEHAATVIELLVACFIAAALVAIVLRSFGDSGATVRQKEARATGAQYDQAIAQFRADHANRNPTAANGDFLIRQGKPAGPKDLLGKPYVGAVPEGVSHGRIGVSMDAGPCDAAPSGSAPETSWISYCPGTDPHYTIRVITRPRPGSPWTGEGVRVCYLGNTPATPRC